jgi:phospholipid transport system transporter-binding protein
MKLPTTLTMATTAAVHRELLAAMSAPAVAGRFEIDASALQEVDSSALALLLDATRQALARGLSLRIQGAPGRLQQLAALYGVAELLGWPGKGLGEPAATPASGAHAPPLGM